MNKVTEQHRSVLWLQISPKDLDTNLLCKLIAKGGVLPRLLRAKNPAETVCVEM